MSTCDKVERKPKAGEKTASGLVAVVLLGQDGKPSGDFVTAVLAAGAYESGGKLGIGKEGDPLLIGTTEGKVLQRSRLKDAKVAPDLGLARCRAGSVVSGCGALRRASADTSKPITLGNGKGKVEAGKATLAPANEPQLVDAGHTFTGLGWLTGLNVGPALCIPKDPSKYTISPKTDLGLPAMQGEGDGLRLVGIYVGDGPGTTHGSAVHVFCPATEMDATGSYLDLEPHELPMAT